MASKDVTVYLSSINEVCICHLKFSLTLYSLDNYWFNIFINDSVTIKCFCTQYIIIPSPFIICLLSNFQAWTSWQIRTTVKCSWFIGKSSVYHGSYWKRPSTNIWRSDGSFQFVVIIVLSLMIENNLIRLKKYFYYFRSPTTFIWISDWKS